MASGASGMKLFRRIPELRTSDKVRFLLKTVITSSGCWQWTSYVDPQGYARFTLDGESYPAHRVAVAMFRGDMPQELVTDHLCRNHACVNPMHLEAVTQRTNVIRGITARALLTAASENSAQAIA